MTFLAADIERVIERTLPARFGGDMADYQLIEEPSADGQTKLRLRVHPRLGPLDEAQVMAAFMDALGSTGDAERIMAHLWQQAGLMGVDRHPPSRTPSDKVLHVHVAGAPRSHADPSLAGVRVTHDRP